MSTESTPAPRSQSVKYADASLIRTQFTGSVAEIHETIGEVTVIARRDGLVQLLTWLRDDPRYKFDFLSDLSGVDLGEFAAPRFAIAYHLYSIQHNHRLRVKVFIEEDDARVPSVIGVWPSANWHEREVWDLFGIEFDNHPDQRRILLPYDYEGHPLRKDFPIKGY
ncbi:MAG: NADH-quinone oxidoreductase subunit C [Blastocatellia bacterium]